MSALELVMLLLNNNDDSQNTSNEIIYTAKELMSLYSKLFSKYKLSQAIKNEGLPYFKCGRERFFKKSDIDIWVNNKRKKND